MLAGMRYTMVTLINLPHEVQYHISNYLRPHTGSGGDEAGGEVKIDPIAKARDVASIKAVHPNLKTVPLWKNREWNERIRKWRDENLTKKRWKYQYGVLPNKMIELGWEDKINKQYRSQDCYVETVFGKAVGTGFVEVTKMYKVIWFEVSLYDLVTGVRPLPHCFGNDGRFHHRADNGSLQIDASIDFAPSPTLETLIPVGKRRGWLIECFQECVLGYWVVGGGDNPDFMKEFKKMMDLPYDYELSHTQLFRMFLKELGVRREDVHEKEGYFKRSESIDDICLRVHFK